MFIQQLEDYLQKEGVSAISSIEMDLVGAKDTNGSLKLIHVSFAEPQLSNNTPRVATQICYPPICQSQRPTMDRLSGQVFMFFINIVMVVLFVIIEMPLECSYAYDI